MIVYKTADNRTYYYRTQKAFARFLEYRLARLPTIPALQMEFYFEGFNWWYYDEEGRLPPNDYPVVAELEDEPYIDDDMPF